MKKHEIDIYGNFDGFNANLTYIRNCNMDYRIKEGIVKEALKQFIKEIKIYNLSPGERHWFKKLAKLQVNNFKLLNNCG